jgi:hypothetical protein
MAKRVEIKKTVLDKKQYKSTIDSKFKFFKELEPVVDPDTIQELFRLYDKLYALIPIEGEEQSHQYLVERSSELYQIDTQLDSIQPLLDEVASLRGQLLENNRRILELETRLAGGGELDFTSAEQMELLRTQLETANATITTLETANSLANRATEQASQAAATAKKKAEDAAKAQAAATSATQAATTSSNSAITEIVKDFGNKRSQLWYAKYLIEKRFFIHISRRWLRRSNISSYGAQYFWLFGETEEEVGNSSWANRRRRGRVSTYKYFIPVSERHAADLTLDFIVEELVQGGYKAGDIVAAIESAGNFKGRVKMRVITYKDPDKEDGVGYRLIK